MARAVGVRCPECGAKIRVDPNRSEVACEYCGTVSRIQKGRAEPPSAPGDPGRPVIRVSSWVGWTWLLFLALPLLAGLGTAGFAVFRSLGGIGDAIGGAPLASSSGAAPSFSFDKVQWVGNRQPMLLDVTGDGIADPMGWIRRISPSAQTQGLAAFDAVTGRMIWSTDPIADLSQAVHCAAALLEDRVIASDALGVLRAFSATNGQVVWSVPLGERVDRICGASPGVARVETKDGRALNAVAATGKVALAGAADRESPCTGVWADVPGETPRFRLDGRPFVPGDPVPEVEGMRASLSLRDLVGGTAYTLGSRAVGTRVPTVAAYDPAGVEGIGPRWMTAVPAVSPLSVEEGAPETAAYAQGRVLVPYGMASSSAGFRLACLDAGTGRSLWDVPIPKSDTGDPSAVVASDRQVFVSMWTYLHVFDMANGAHRVTIGEW